MYYPKCRAEYREGFTECSDCRVALVAEKPLAPQGPGEPGLELVTVLENGDPLVIAAAKGILEEAEIPFYVLGDEIGARYGPVDDFIRPWRRIQVARDRETEARAVLERFEEVDSTGGQQE